MKLKIDRESDALYFRLDDETKIVDEQQFPNTLVENDRAFLVHG